MLDSALTVNSYMPKYIANSIEKVISDNNLKSSVIVCGLSYKQDIEDMRDSSGFKIITELKKKGMKVVGYDPYYNEILKERYMIENHLNNPINTISNLSDDSIDEFDCICIVQNHTKIRFDIEKIYSNSKISFIYDCQNSLNFNSESKTILRKLG